MASIDRIKSRTTLLAAPQAFAGRQRKLKGAGPQSPDGSGFTLAPRRPRGRHNGRRRRTHGAVASVRRNWRIPNGHRATAHGATGAYCAWTVRFFVLEPPWRKPFLEQIHALLWPGAEVVPSGKQGLEVNRNRIRYKGKCQRPKTVQRRFFSKGAGPAAVWGLAGPEAPDSAVLSCSSTAKGRWEGTTASAGGSKTTPGARG
jgi:hypothetical protein